MTPKQYENRILNEVVRYHLRQMLCSSRMVRHK
jgi:hypothetical protein